MSDLPKEVVVDDRRRTSLAKVGRKQDRRYLVEEYDDGTLVLVPAVTVSQLELAVLRNPELRESLANARDGDRRQLKRRGSFAGYADSED